LTHDEKCATLFRMKTVQQRIIDNSKPVDTGCWEWQKHKGEWGYGAIKVAKKVLLAHRASYAAFKGPPGDLCVLHTCDNPGCVNPEHLWLGTNKDNVNDKVKKGRQSRISTHCTKPNDRRTNLTKEDVLAIRASSENQPTLAKKYNITQSNVSMIINRVTWTHI